MASSSHQQGSGHLKSKSSNSPWFFKIILQDTIRNGKLGIPSKFVKNHGNSMSSPALLGVPSGAVWKVELTKCDGRIWLENGWQEFSNHHSLDFGHLLVFRYDGNSSFHVLIFDKSASEIQYPYTRNDHWRSDEIPKQSEDDDSIQIPGYISPSRKIRKESQSPCPRPHKMMRGINVDIITEFNGKSGFLAPKVRHNGYLAREGDKTSKPENPSFPVVMQPSYLGRGRLSIPHNFAKKHLMKEHCSVVLCSSSGKTWIATFKQTLGKKLNSFLYTGWDTFVRDNNIQVGDVCTFELINSTEITFKVFIYKGQHATCHQRLANATQDFPGLSTAHGKAKGFQIASAFKSKHPSFVVVLHQSYAHLSKLRIPMDFARKHLAEMHKEAILLLSNGKSWQVMYDQHRLERFDVCLRNGWRKFAEDNNLEVGDACVFELMKGSETSMKVTVCKKQAVEDANLGSSLEEATQSYQGLQQDEAILDISRPDQCP